MDGQLARPSRAGAETTLATATIVVASLGFGLVPLFARGLLDAGMAPASIAFWRFALTGILLLPLAWRRHRPGRAALWAVGAGIALGLGWIGYANALRFASVATVGVVYMSYPLFAMLFAWLLLRQRPGLRAWIGGALILLAAGLALTPGGQAPGNYQALLLSLSAPLTFGAAIAILTVKLQGLTPLERVLFASLGSTAALLPVLLVLGPSAFIPTDAHQLLLLLGVAVVTAALPQLLYVVAAPKVGAARAAVAGSMELPTMFLIGWLAFDEAIEPVHIFAGVLVVTAILLTPPSAPPASVAPAGSEDDTAPR